MPKDQPSQPERARPSDIAVPGQVAVASDGRVYEVELVPTGALPSWIAREIGSPQWDDRRRTFFLNEWGIDLSAAELRRAARDMKPAARKTAKNAVTFRRVAAYERPSVTGYIGYIGENAVWHQPPVPHVRHNYGDGWGADIGPGQWDERHDLSAAGMAFARSGRFLNASSAGVLARSSPHVIDAPSRAVLAQAIAAGLRDPAIKGATLRDLERALNGPGAAVPAAAGDGLRIWFTLSGCATVADFAVLLEWALRTLRGIPPFRPLFICGATEESALRVVEQLSELIDPVGFNDIEPKGVATSDPAIDDGLVAKWRVWKKHGLLITGRAGVLEGADDLDSEDARSSGDDLDDLDSEDALASGDDLDDLEVDPEDALAPGRDIVWLGAIPDDGVPEGTGPVARRGDLVRWSANFGDGVILDGSNDPSDGGYDLAFGPGGTARGKKPPGTGLRMAGRVSASGLASARALHPHERPWWEDMVIAGIDAERAAARTPGASPAPAAHAAIYDATGIVEGRYPPLLPLRYLVLTKLEQGYAPRTPGYYGTVQHCNDVLNALARRFQPVLSSEARGDPATGLNGHRPLVAFGGRLLNRAHLDTRGYDVIQLGGPLDADATSLWPRARGKPFADLARVIRAELYEAAAAGLYAEQNGQDPAGSWQSAPGLSASAADAERAVRLIWLAVLATELVSPDGTGAPPPRLSSAPAPPSLSRPAARAALADPVVRVIALELLGWLARLEGFPAIEERSFAPQELMRELAARAPKGSLDKLQNGGRLNDKGVRSYLAAPERQALLRGIGIEAYMPAGHGKKGRRIIFKRRTATD